LVCYLIYDTLSNFFFLPKVSSSVRTTNLRQSVIRLISHEPNRPLIIAHVYIIFIFLFCLICFLFTYIYYYVSIYYMHNKQASFVHICIESIYTLHRSHFEIYLPKQSQKQDARSCAHNHLVLHQIKHAPLDFMYCITSAIHGRSFSLSYSFPS
jgi:hypothetical protein